MEFTGILIWLTLVGYFAMNYFAGGRAVARRVSLIRQIEHKHGSRLITMIHRQSTNRFMGVPTSTMIDLEDAPTLISAIKSTPADRPIDLVLHTPGGLVLAAMQIARAIEAHPAKVTVYVPIYAMSGGTLLALAADEIVLGEFSVLGPVDPQLAGLPAASIVAARDAKSVNEVGDLTLIIADVSEKSINQVRSGVEDLLRKRMGDEKAKQIADKLATGTWTHDYGITATEAAEIGLPVKTGMPEEILELMALYPQPVRMSSVDVLPLEDPAHKPLRRWV